MDEVAGILVQIDDDGPGISEERMEQMFEPFQRLEESRSRETGGIGLGLAIAKKILQDHGGDVELVESGPEGTSFRLTLPIAEVEQS